MAEPPKEPDKLTESEAEDRFRRGVANALKMPHKPHKLNKKEPEDRAR